MGRVENFTKMNGICFKKLVQGCCEGLSYEEIQKKYPLEFAMRDQNKLTYKYPNGESYEDVLTRVETVIEKIEKTEKEDEQKIRLIVSHQAVLRCLLSHFLCISESKLYKLLLKW